MTEFLQVVTSFPTVIFTVGLLISLGFWLISTVLGLGDSAFDADVDLDTDLDLDADVDVDIDVDGVGSGAEGLAGFTGILVTLGLHLMPISLVITVISLAGWVAAIVATVALGGAPLNLLVGVVVFVFAFVFGVLVSGRVARLLAPLFAVTRAAGHRHLIGRLCTLRTGRVDASFGQAEVVDGDGGTHLIQVRCTCLLYTSPSPRDATLSRMPSSA